MTTTVFRALERVFAAEIQGRMLQSKAKIYNRLAQDGMVQFTEHRLEGRFPVRIQGWP